MNILPLQQLGARESSGVVSFGMFLPYVSPNVGYEVWVKVIHEQDQFLKAVLPHEFPLGHQVDSTYGDYWSGQVSVSQHSPSTPTSVWGQPGRYVYRYEIRHTGTNMVLDWVTDPYAREFGIGKLSAFTLGYQPYQWSNNENAWQVPELHDLVFYELQISEFAQSIDGMTERLNYLADLGINCIEVMPVTNITTTIDWGFVPIGYFGVDERFGKRSDLQRMIDAAHQRGIAVIVDAIYGHTGHLFAYEYVYSTLGLPSPMMGSFANDYFGSSTDWGKGFTQDFFYTVNLFWLEYFHVDGLRYDCVPNYYDGFMGQGYAKLVYETHQAVKMKINTPGYWRRFGGPGGPIKLIQCAEQLESPREVVEKTYSNCSWQNETLAAAQKSAAGKLDQLTTLGFMLGLDGYPLSVTHNNDIVPKTALQYIENHDQQRFVCNFNTVTKGKYELFKEGNRSQWYRLQPYLIALLAAKGIPMLWQGQELGENYWMEPNDELGRIAFPRPVRWDYFYDDVGKRLIWLVRKLLEIRRHRTHFRRGSYFFYNNYGLYQSKSVLLFSRGDSSVFSLIALNFSNTSQTVPFLFPMTGTYKDELHGLPLVVTNPSAPTAIDIPSNYGRIWSL